MIIYTVIECNEDDAFMPHNVFTSHDPADILEELADQIDEAPDDEQENVKEVVEPTIEAFKKLVEDRKSPPAIGHHVLTEPYILYVAEI